MLLPEIPIVFHFALNCLHLFTLGLNWSTNIRKFSFRWKIFEKAGTKWKWEISMRR